MTSPQPSTSSTQADISLGKESLRLVERVLWKLEEEKQKGTTFLPIDDCIERAFHYTGIQNNMLAKMQLQGIHLTKIIKLDRSLIHNELMNFYLIKRMLPTSKDLFISLHGKTPNHIDLMSFRKILFQMGYVWKKLPDRKMVIFEQPSITFERFQYLRDITKYRSEKRPILFITENIIDWTGKLIDFNQSDDSALESQPCRHIIYAVSNAGIHCIRHVQEFNEESFEKYILEDLQLTLSRPSVIVLDKAKHHERKTREPPTINSVKIDMINWLLYNDIPYEQNMSKAELFDLIEKFTNIEETEYKIDSVLKLNHHVVLRIPDCINQLTPTPLVLQLIRQNLPIDISDDTEWPQLQLNSVAEILSKILNTITEDHLKNIFDFVRKEECHLLNHDIQTDKTMDELVDKTMASSLEQEDSEIPDSSDSE